MKLSSALCFIAASVQGAALVCERCSETSLGDCNTHKTTETCVADDSKVGENLDADGNTNAAVAATCKVQLTLNGAGTVVGVSSGCSTKQACEDKQRDNRRFNDGGSIDDLHAALEQCWTAAAGVAQGKSAPGRRFGNANSECTLCQTAGTTLTHIAALAADSTAELMDGAVDMHNT